MTQLWPEGIPLQVAGENLPDSFPWQGRRRFIHAIVEQWIVRDEWWQQEIWRHYYQVETTDGLLCVLFRDLLRDSWHLERLYD